MNATEQLALQKTLVAIKSAATGVRKSAIQIEEVIGSSRVTQDIRNNAYDMEGWAEKALTFVSPDEPRQDIQTKSSSLLSTEKDLEGGESDRGREETTGWTEVFVVVATVAVIVFWLWLLA